MMHNFTEELDFNKTSLLPAVVQDWESGEVLMLGYMNREALEKTLKSRRVTFFSRSRQRLWTKGETSGNFLQMVSIHRDCDGDALLVQARPAGPVCHTGRRSCFGEGHYRSFLGVLERVIRDRRKADPEKSYCARLLQEGPERAAQKVGEEAVEVAIEAVRDSGNRLVEESADLVFHLLLLLQSRDLSWGEVMGELLRRHPKG